MTDPTAGRSAGTPLNALADPTSARLAEDVDGPGRAVDADDRAVDDQRRRRFGADHRRKSVLAGDDGGVAEDPTGVRHERG